jgi:hypothetical protein
VIGGGERRRRGRGLYGRRGKWEKKERKSDLKIGPVMAWLECVRPHSCQAHVVQKGLAFELIG